MTEYRKARPEEEADILDFINLVFSQSSQPHHFDRLLPKVYAHPGFSAYHVVAARAGHIRATVAMTPLTLRLSGAAELTAGFLGSVSVHEKERGAGHMKALMKMILAEAEEKDYDFLALGGQRQRYGHWDFEKGGARLEFSLNEANIRHALKDVDGDAVAFREITADTDPALDQIAALGARQALTCPRPRALLLDILHSWENTLWALEDRKNAGAFLGYCTTQGDQIVELALEDDGRTEETLKAFMQGRAHGRVEVPAYLPGQARRLKAFAEGYTISDAEMFKVLHWDRVLEALLNFKMTYQPLPSGRLVYAIEGAGCLALSVQDGKALVAPTEESPLRVLSRRQATELFFSPFAALMEEHPLTRAWLPLPLEIPSAHAF